MTGLVEVFAGVPVRARVAAADVSTGQTLPQVRPGVLAVLFAFLAVARRARFGFGGIGRGLEVFTRSGDRGRVCVASA
jgi:hypothetical protein